MSKPHRIEGDADKTCLTCKHFKSPELLRLDSGDRYSGACDVLLESLRGGNWMLGKMVECYVLDNFGCILHQAKVTP